MSERKWEHCQVYRECEYKSSGFLGILIPIKATYTFRFFADAISPTKGKYTCEKSQRFAIMAHDGGKDVWPSNDFEDSKDAKKILDKFVVDLISQGWEPISERGNNWWHLRFKRIVK